MTKLKSTSDNDTKCFSKTEWDWWVIFNNNYCRSQCDAGISQYRLPTLAISIITLCECVLGSGCRSTASGINRQVACKYAVAGISFYIIESGGCGMKYRKVVIISIVFLIPVVKTPPQKFLL